MTFRTRPPPNSNGTPFSFLFLHLSFSLFLHCFCSLSLLSLNSIPGVNVRCFLGMKISLYCLAMKRKRGKTRNPSSLAADEMFPNVSQKSNNVHLQTEFWVSNQNKFLSSHITWSIWVLIVLNRALMNVKRKTMMWWQARAHLLSAATHTHLRAMSSNLHPITLLQCYHATMMPWYHQRRQPHQSYSVSEQIRTPTHTQSDWQAFLSSARASSCQEFIILSPLTCFIFELCMQTFWGPVIRLALALSLFGYAFKRRGALHIIEVCWASNFCFLSVSASSPDLEAASSPHTLALITLFFFYSSFYLFVVMVLGQ